MFMKRTDKHADLVFRMSNVLGIDIAEDMLRGTFSPEQFRADLFRCIGCACTSQCESFLAAHAETGATEAPDYCRNKVEFDRVSAAKRMAT